MKFKSIVRRLINEDKRLDALYDKFIVPALENPNSELAKLLTVTIGGKTYKPFEVFKKIIKMDPTTVADGIDWDRAKKSDLEDIKTGQYVNWLLRTFLKPKEFSSDYESGSEGYEEQFKTYQKEILEDEDLVKGLLAKYYKYQKRIPEDKRNIMDIDGVQALMNIPIRATASGEEVRLIEFEGALVSKALVKGDEQLTQDSPQIRFSYPGSKILKVGSNYTLVTIPAGGDLGQKAASHFGGYYLGSSNPGSNETNWCTSPENSHNFRNYISQAPLYIFLANDDKGQVGVKSGLPKERYQIHFGSYRQAKDRLNGTIDFASELANGKFAEFKEFFKSEFKKGVGSSSFSTSEKNGEYTIKLNNPNPGATSDYVKIYGREDLEVINPEDTLRNEIENIPTSAAQLKIVNDTREQLYIDIPEEILKLTNLHTINITNIAKSVPNNFSTFTKLKFLSFAHNPELKSIPNGLEKCPIVFINLMGSDNVVLTPEQLEYFEVDDEPYFYTKK